MEHKTVAAATVDTTETQDLGEFTAIAAAWTEDRERDIIHRGAFAQTIGQWQDSGKKMPLHWDHKGDPQNIIGFIDPTSMVETEEGLLVKGQLDIHGSALARGAWRLIKQGVVGLSFGYLATKKQDRPGGGRDLFEIDMFETSITPAPMHPATRILEAKHQEATPTEGELREQSLQLEREVMRDEHGELPEVKAEPESAPTETETTPAVTVDEGELRRETAGVERDAELVERERLQRGLGEVPEPRPPVPDPLPEPEPEPEPVPAESEMRHKTAVVDREADRLRRDRLRRGLRGIPKPRPPEPEPEPEPEAVVSEGDLRRKTVDVERQAELAKRERLTRELTGVPTRRPGPPDPDPEPARTEPEVEPEADLRRKTVSVELEAKRVERERLERGLADVPERRPDVESALAPAPEEPPEPLEPAKFKQLMDTVDGTMDRLIRERTRQDLADVPPVRPPEPEPPAPAPAPVVSEEALRRETGMLERERLAAELPAEPAGVDSVTRRQLKALATFYQHKPQPFLECVRANTDRFGPDGAVRVCSALQQLSQDPMSSTEPRRPEVDQ